jgi:hypothetical protein
MVRNRALLERGLQFALVALLIPVGESAADQPTERSRPSKRSVQSVAGTIVVGEIDRRTLRAALEALPRRPARIEVVDDSAAPPALQQLTRDLDGFVPIGSDVIYLRRQSVTLREAESGGPFVLMLAAVIWHEMAHAEGLDEQQARRREEDLWKQFVQKGLVDSALGLTYLDELRRRR